VGGNETIRVDVRIVSSTNKDLQEAIANNLFREDLFYRLHVVGIQLPPLRERTEDIPILAYYFLRKYNKENNKNLAGFSDDVIHFFMNYRWPGNVRELKNVVAHGVIVAKKDQIMLDDLPNFLRNNSNKETFMLPSNKTLAELEREYIYKVLQENDWNRSKAARILGIERMTLYNKIKSYGITVKR